MTKSITGAGWAALDAEIAAEVALPGSAGYELARKPPIARFHDVRPEAVVRCANPSDVTATISLARRAGLPTAIRSGGHCFAGHSSTGGILIDVSPMRSVAVEGEVATVARGRGSASCTTRWRRAAAPSPPAAGRRSASPGSGWAAGSGSWAAGMG